MEASPDASGALWAASSVLTVPLTPSRFTVCPSSGLWPLPGAHAQPSASLLRTPGSLAPVDVKMIFALPSLLRWTSSRRAPALCSHLMFGFCCLFLPHYLPSVYTGDPVSLALRKTVVLRAFLGRVPECSGKWDKDSGGLLSRGSATRGRSPFPVLLCPCIESPTVTFLAAVTPPALRPEWRPSRAGPRCPCLLPASLDGAWASTMCGES